MTRIEIRPERSSDHPRVDEIQRAAFGQKEEAELVTALRERADPILSLVAEIPAVRSTDVSALAAANVAGHVFFLAGDSRRPRRSTAARGARPARRRPSLIDI